MSSADDQRATLRAGWDRAASAWDAAADSTRDWAMPVSVAMIDALGLQPGQRVVELAAGPGDTGFMAAELVAPGGSVLCSDGAEPMVEVARRRAEALGVRNAEFRALELEWIDLPTADADAVLCRWGIMLIVDSAAAAREIRRILRPGGHAALAVWDLPERNPWATIPRAPIEELAGVAPPEPGAPSMFKLGADGVLEELLSEAGFTDVTVRPVAIERRFADVDTFIGETLAISPSFSELLNGLSEGQRAEARERIARDSMPYTADDGSLVLPGSSLVARAVA